MVVGVPKAKATENNENAEKSDLGLISQKRHQLARLDCGEAECIHYRWLGCHGCDDPMNQSACALPLDDGYECLMSEDHILFESLLLRSPLVSPAACVWWNRIFMLELRKGIYKHPLNITLTSSHIPYKHCNKQYLSGHILEFIHLHFIPDSMWGAHNKSLYEAAIKLARRCAEQLPPKERNPRKIALRFGEKKVGPFKSIEFYLGWEYKDKNRRFQRSDWTSRRL